MSFGQLLAVGQSVKEVGGPNRYRLTGADFRARLVPAPAVAPLLRRRPAQAYSAAKFFMERQAAKVAEQSRIFADVAPTPSAPPVVRESSPATAVAQAGMPAALGKARTAKPTSWSVGRWMKKTMGIRGARGKSEFAMQQAELSLDHVKVIRNDLNDAGTDLVSSGVTVQTMAGNQSQGNRSVWAGWVSRLSRRWHKQTA